MVQVVARDDVSQRLDIEEIIRGDSLPRPALFGQVEKKAERGFAHGAEFGDVLGETYFVGARGCGGDILIHPGQGASETAGEPVRAEQHHAFGIRDMVQHLPDGPLAFGIAMQRFLFRYATKKRNRGFELRFQDGDDVARRNELRVSVVVRGRFHFSSLFAGDALEFRYAKSLRIVGGAGLTAAGG